MRVRSLIVISVVCLFAGHAASRSEAAHEAPVSPPSERISVINAPPAELAACVCSPEKEEECEARGRSCCATRYGDGTCKIYCGSACLAPD